MCHLMFVFRTSSTYNFECSKRVFNTHNINSSFRIILNIIQELSKQYKLRKPFLRIVERVMRKLTSYHLRATTFLSKFLTTMTEKFQNDSDAEASFGIQCDTVNHMNNLSQTNLYGELSSDIDKNASNGQGKVVTTKHVLD